MCALPRVQVGELARQPGRLGKLASAGTRSATNLSGMLQRTTAAVKARPRSQPGPLARLRARLALRLAGAVCAVVGLCEGWW